MHPWLFWTCLIIWIVLHYWIDLYVAFTPPSTMSTSYCHSFHLPISLCCYCIIELYWLVFLPCIIALHCIFAYTPQSTVSTGLYLFSSPTCLLVWLYFSCRTDDLFVLTLYIITCILTFTFIVANSSASTIVEGSRPCTHPYKSLLSWGKLVFASYHWLLSADYDVASVALSLISISGF